MNRPRHYDGRSRRALSCRLPWQNGTLYLSIRIRVACAIKTVVHQCTGTTSVSRASGGEIASIHFNGITWQRPPQSSSSLGRMPVSYGIQVWRTLLGANGSHSSRRRTIGKNCKGLSEKMAITSVPPSTSTEMDLLRAKAFMPDVAGRLHSLSATSSLGLHTVRCLSYTRANVR